MTLLSTHAKQPVHNLHLHPFGIENGVPISDGETIRQASEVLDHPNPTAPAVVLLRGWLSPSLDCRSSKNDNVWEVNTYGFAIRIF